MLFAALNDLNWRRRRLLVAVTAASLVFALSLVMSGIASGFRNEVDRTLSVIGADYWVGRKGDAGPLRSSAALPEQLADSITGPSRIDPIVLSQYTVAHRDSSLTDVSLFGVVPGGVGSPEPQSGRALTGRGQVVVDSSLGYRVGDRLVLAGTSFDVVGMLTGARLYAGMPTAFISLRDAQKMSFGGRPLARAFVAKGTPAKMPSDLVMFSNEQTRADLLRPIQGAHRSITFIRTLLWVIAAIIVGSIVYASVLERMSDVALFKAVGFRDRSVISGVVMQSVVLTLLSSVVAIWLAAAIAPLVPLTSEIPSASQVMLPMIALVVGGVAALFGVRRLVSISPVAAFGAAS